MPFDNSNIAVDKTAIDTLVDYGKALAAPGQAVTTEPIHYAVIPSGEGTFKIQSLQDYQFPQGLPPLRIKATPKLQDGKSFCTYVGDFKDDRLRVFADANTSTVFAVIDYHTPEIPEFCQHSVLWRMDTSPQWKIWKGMNETPMGQEAFVEFLEDNWRDIKEPTHAVLHETIRDLKIHSTVAFESKINIKSGAVEFTYNEDMKTVGKLEMPDEFKIFIPVFFGEPPVEINCRFRYRIPQGKLSVFYKMYRPVETQLEAFKLAVEGIEEALGVNVHLGTSV